MACVPPYATRTHVWLLFWLLCLPGSQAKIFSATIRWERAGATPQLLRNVCDPDFCRNYPCQAQGCFMNGVATGPWVQSDGCVDFNFDMEAGCSTYDHRTILFTVDAVFHDSAFPDIYNLPAVGTKASTDPPTQFCIDSACSSVQLSILAHSETQMGAKIQKLIYVRYQRLYSYPSDAPIWKSTVSFMTIGTLKRFPQCTYQNSDPPQQATECGQEDRCFVCLAPSIGAVIQDCKECLSDFEDSNLEVSTTVHFSDYCLDASTEDCPAGCTNAGIGGAWTIDETQGCMTPWDTAIADSHKLHPITNHHSPHATMLPVVTVPRLDRQTLSSSMVVAAVDEDGLGRPITACNSTSNCNNIVPFWAMNGMGYEVDVPADGVIPGYTQILYTDSPRTLTTHSDQVPKDDPLGRWRLGQRDDRDGGGVTLEIEGPLKEPDTLFADAMYPARLSVGDPMHMRKDAHRSPEPKTPAYLATTIEFMIRTCKELKPYVMDQTGVQLYPDQVGKIGAIFSTRTQSGRYGKGHYHPTGLIQCYAGSPCVFQVAATIYESNPGNPMHRFGRCNWGDSIVNPLTGQNQQNSSMCADNVRKLSIATGARVYVDSTHAGLQGCPNSLISNDGTSQSCHKIEHLEAEGAGEGLYQATGVLNISLFERRGLTGGVGVGGGGEGKYTRPYEFDIGRKIPMCFQARECATCCYSIPHCITVEILGRVPEVLSPAAQPTCPTTTFKSDLKPLDLLPNRQQFSSDCPHLYVCWTERDELTPQTEPGPPLETAAFYSHPPLVQKYLFSAEDADEGETVDVNLLWTAEASTISLIDETLVNFSPYTLHPGSSCNQQATPGRVQHLYKLDRTCREGWINLEVELTYSRDWKSRLGNAQGRTPLYTLNGPQIDGPVDGYYHVEFDEDKTLCFTTTDNQAAKWGRGLNNSAIRCHVMRFRGPPAFVRHHQRPLDSPFLKFDANLMGYGVQTIEAFVGEEVSLTVRARDPNPEDIVTIFPNEDPGLPIGSTLDRGVCVEHGMVSDKTGVEGSQVFSGCSENIRVFRWRPVAGTEGKLYRVCFVARDNQPFCRVSNPPAPASTPLSPPRATELGFYSAPYCAQINVTEARVRWLQGTEATQEGANRILNVGCKSSYVVRATGGQYPVVIYPTPSRASERAEDARFPVADIKIETVSNADNIHDALVVWEPQRGSEGSITRVCVVAAPKGWAGARSTSYITEFGNPAVVGGRPYSEERCFVFKVERCKYCVAEGETLLTKMRLFTPDMNWLRLWAFNGADDGDDRTLTLDDPDLLASVGQHRVINVGILYKPRAGEDIQNVAERMRTTVKSLLSLNPDVESQLVRGVGSRQPLSQDAELCVIPCSSMDEMQDNILDQRIR